MEIPQSEVISTKKIGHLGAYPVFEVRTLGGLNLVLTKKGGVTEILGAGSHRAVARFIARKKESKLVIDELTKSDYISEEHFVDLVPQFEILTDALNQRIRTK